MHSFRQLYLRRFLRALHSLDCSNSSKNLGLFGRRRAIKLAADISLALTASGSVWSHALISSISRGKKDKILLRKIVGRKKDMMTVVRRRNLLYLHLGSVLPMSREPSTQKKMARKSYLRASRLYRHSCRRLNSSTLATKLVRKRTKVLQSLIPGGKSMETSCLLKEAVDYIVALETQVEVMEFLANSVHCKRNL